LTGFFPLTVERSDLKQNHSKNLTKTIIFSSGNSDFVASRDLQLRVNALERFRVAIYCDFHL